MKLIKIIILFTIIISLNCCEKNEQDNASIITTNVTNITACSATSGAQIASDGKLSVLFRGVCWSKKQNPTLDDDFSIDGNEFGSYSSNIINLNADNTYYVRAYYINSLDTVYGNQVEFTTPDYIQYNPDLTYSTVTDIDGNVYRTITIGTQTWMAENLKTTRYQNGDTIPNVTNTNIWSTFGVSTGAYCYYDYNNSKTDIYGAYYNWFAAIDIRNIAPTGWHVATEDDWQTLKDYCEYYIYGQDCSYQLRETTTAHWKNNNLIPKSTNETGFTALPADRALTNGDIGLIDGFNAYFWTSSGNEDIPVAIFLNDDLNITTDQNYKGFSIRCIKD